MTPSKPLDVDELVNTWREATAAYERAREQIETQSARRRQVVAQLLAGGLSCRKIADLLGISTSRVGVIVRAMQ